MCDNINLCFNKYVKCSEEHFYILRFYNTISALNIHLYIRFRKVFKSDGCVLKRLSEDVRAKYYLYL